MDRYTGTGLERKVTKTMRNYGAVTPQVFLLMIGGLWPIWKRPFQKFKVQNSVLVAYASLMFLCHSVVFACDMNRHIQVARSSFDVKLYSTCQP